MERGWSHSEKLGDFDPRPLNAFYGLRVRLMEDFRLEDSRFTDSRGVEISELGGSWAVFVGRTTGMVVVKASGAGAAVSMVVKDIDRVLFKGNWREGSGKLFFVGKSIIILEQKGDPDSYVVTKRGDGGTVRFKGTLPTV